MLIACVHRPDEIGPKMPDLIVVPEYSASSAVRQVASACPDSVIVTAVEENGRSRALLLRQGRNRIDYLNIGTDGRSTGTGRWPSSAVCHFPHMSVGVVICMDVMDHNFLNNVIRQLRTGNARHKVLCISADMGSEWFQTDMLLGDFENVHVAMCNQPSLSEPHARLQSPSFITDTHGTKQVKRADAESICLHLD
jgi:hypothetical protein